MGGNAARQPLRAETYWTNRFKDPLLGGGSGLLFWITAVIQNWSLKCRPMHGISPMGRAPYPDFEAISACDLRQGDLSESYRVNSLHLHFVLLYGSFADPYVIIYALKGLEPQMAPWVL